MTGRLPLPSAVSVFRADESVIQSLPLLPDAVSPLFGDATGPWDLNGVVARPVNQNRAQMRVQLHGLSPQWNLMARELVMILFNPRHPAVLQRGVHLPVTPHKVNTVRRKPSYLRDLAAFGTRHQLPDDIEQWGTQYFEEYIRHKCDPEASESLAGHVLVIKELHRLRPVLACGGVKKDPWPDLSAREVLELPRSNGMRTPVIKPDVWFPLVRAAWTYINTFGPDILRAVDRWTEMQERFQNSDFTQAPQHLEAWLADPDSRVPLHHSGTTEDAVNWSLLNCFVALDYRKHNLFKKTDNGGLGRRAQVMRLVEAGRTQIGLLPDLAEVDRPDGTRGPWHDSLQPCQIWAEAHALRNACYIFVTALSMMRDSEVRSIVKGSVVEYYSTPAVKATKQKLDPDLPTRHWWIIAPVADALLTLDRLSQHPQLAFASVPGGQPGELFESKDAIKYFIGRVNRRHHVTGLQRIPPQHVTPHMFRRTMAMLTRDFPGAEIAVGMQLKHVATRALSNLTTDGYMEPDRVWAQHLNNAIEQRRFEQLKEMFDADCRGETIGYGPGADRMREAFAEVRHKAEELRSTGKAQRGDVRVEHDLLRRARVSIRFGKLNHCTMNDDDPAGAKCIEDAIVPEGHRGPLPDRCRPTRCGNSVIAPAHLPIWRAERISLTKLRESPGLSKNRRAQIDAEIHEVDRALQKAGE
ncbi:hypothetical protein ACFV98_17610 [Streptomyces violascens]|uniref:hypothetical protein n=1 Tax=Streptomyces violascens TaxID=67381 RepID=UPI0036672113